MFKNWFVTMAGIMASMLGVPVAVTTYYATVAKMGPPTWWNAVQFPLVLVGIIGTVLIGVAAKGADTHSTVAQVQASSSTVNAVTPAQADQAKVQVVQADQAAAKKP
jgi:hypothetical protein